jgi:hypothetical protein
MKRSSILLAGVAFFALTAGGALADCTGEIAQLSPGTTTGSVSGSSGGHPGISKDGSLAPLQSGPSTAATGSMNSSSAGQGSSATSQGVSKDGSTMPLASRPGGGSADVATSKQDAQSQQQGGKTAAAAAGQGSSQPTSGSHASGSNTAAAGGISKDGSLAPLQSGPSTTGAMGTSGSGSHSASAPGQGISKDGSTMPLASQPGGGSANIATSKQDAQSQQQGGQTAAAAAGQGEASSGNRSPRMMAALERARMLHQQGNEAGCMQAVEEAKRLR